VRFNHESYYCVMHVYIVPKKILTVVFHYSSAYSFMYTVINSINYKYSLWLQFRFSNNDSTSRVLNILLSCSNNYVRMMRWFVNFFPDWGTCANIGKIYFSMSSSTCSFYTVVFSKHLFNDLCARNTKGNWIQCK